MANVFTGIVPQLRAAVEKTVADCLALGVTMVPNSGLRTPQAQAKLWRQGRTTSVINAEIARLRAAGADFLADCIQSAGPQSGDKVTGTIPGNSWHQWGEAMDCYWRHNGKVEWSSTLLGAQNGYRIYANCAEANGLTAGGHWQNFKDWPHVQRPADDNPMAAGHSLLDIDAKMRALFG